MSYSNKKLKRLYLIVKRLNTKKQTREDIMEMLERNELGIGIATFERDKSTLKYDFGIDLIYDSYEKTYSIAMPDDHELAFFIQFLEYQQLAATIGESLSDRKTASAYIDFENENQLSGIEQLDRLFYATKNHQVIKFKHRKFETPHALSYTLKPYLLKEYQSRWYVIGTNKHDNFRSFGIDRIEELEVTSETFNPKPNTIKQVYRSCVGVSEVMKPRELVKLKFDISQKEYLEHLPLHYSQDNLEETETHVIYEYYVVNNFEFRQQILKYGGLVQVLSPQTLADQIKADLKTALELYR